LQERAAAPEQQQSGGSPVQIDLLTTQIAADVVLYMLFGRDVPFDPNLIRDSTSIVTQMLMHCAMTPYHAFMRYIPGTSCWNMDRRRDAAWKALDDTVADEVRSVLNELDQPPLTAEQDLRVQRRSPGAALPSLCRNETNYSSVGLAALVAEVRVLLLAGFETTAHGLSFAFGHLALHPDIADQIASEGRAMWDTLTNENASSKEIQQALDEAPTAKYLFLETVRLYPLAPTLAGMVKEDLTVTTGSGSCYRLEKKTKVLFMNQVLNRECTDKFTLDHWKHEPYPFLNTFNTGVHVCPGKNLSLFEAHVFLLMAVTQFTFEHPSADKAMESTGHILLQPVDGMPLLVRRRKF
jgi:cytochrome P450